MMVRLRSDCGIETSRVGAYARGDPALIDLMTR